MSFLPSLRALPIPQLPSKRFNQRLGAVDRPANRIGSAQWVLSRPLYHFRRFDLKHVPRAQRSQALRLQIRQWSPSANPGQYVVWDQHHALVWAWDADRLNAELSAQRLKSASTRVIPESLLHPPLVSGWRLVACLDGIEGQFWQDRYPIQSRWWPKAPTASEWLNFQRDTGASAGHNEPIPTPQVPTWLKQPWAKSVDLRQSDNQTLAHEGLLIGCATLLLAGLTTWEAIELIKTRQSIAQLNAQVEEVDRNARPLLDARRQSMESLARVKTLEATNPFPPQLTLLAEVSKLLSDDSSYLNEWDYQNGRLKVIIASPNKVSSSSFVKRLQDVGWFANVQAASSNDASALALTMDTLPKREVRSRSESFPAPAPEKGQSLGAIFTTPTPGQGRPPGGNVTAPTPGQGQSLGGNFPAPTPGQGQSLGGNFPVPTPGQAQSPIGGNFAAPTPAQSPSPIGGNFAAPTPAQIPFLLGGNSAAPTPGQVQENRPVEPPKLFFPPKP